METHWRKIHPRVWEILEDDDRKDWAELDRLEEEWQKAVQCGELTVEVEKEIDDLQSKLRKRIILRANRFLGAFLCFFPSLTALSIDILVDSFSALHEVRNAAFATEAACKAGLTIDEFLQALPTGDLSRFATHPAASRALVSLLPLSPPDD